MAVGTDTDQDVTSVSFDTMLRLPLLTNEEFPTGRLQPYITLGPGVYFSHFDTDPAAPLGKYDTNAGVKVGVGSTWMLNPESRNIWRV